MEGFKVEWKNKGKFHPNKIGRNYLPQEINAIFLTGDQLGRCSTGL